MADIFTTSSTGFSSTVQEQIRKDVLTTLRAGLVSLPKGSVAPARLIAMDGKNYVVRFTAYPDFAPDAVTEALSETSSGTGLEIGVDTQDLTVSEFGAWAQITSRARFQSPHSIFAIAQDKVKRLAVDRIDAIGLAALATITSANDTGGALVVSDIVDAVTELRSRNVQPTANGTYNCLLHPRALAGLLNDTYTNGWIDIAKITDKAALSSGAVGQLMGVTFITSTKFEPTLDVYPVYFAGAESIMAGDAGTLSYHVVKDAGVGNELNLFQSCGARGIFGAAPIIVAETTDGAGTNGATVERVLRIGVSTGVFNPYV